MDRKKLQAQGMGLSIYDVHTRAKGWTPADGGGGKRHVDVRTEN